MIMGRIPAPPTSRQLRAGSACARCHEGPPVADRRGCATCAIAPPAKGLRGNFRAICEINMAVSAPMVRTSPLTAIPAVRRSRRYRRAVPERSNEISSRASGSGRPKHLRLVPYGNEQLQSVHNAGLRGIAESRSFIGVTFPAAFGVFFEIRRPWPAKGQVCLSNDYF